MKNYRYVGPVSGQMAGVGYVENGKIIETRTQAQVDKIEEILAADKKHKREPTFVLFDGRVTATNRATVPLEDFGVYPERDDQTAEAPKGKRGQGKAAAAVNEGQADQAGQAGAPELAKQAEAAATVEAAQVGDAATSTTTQE